MSMMVMTTATFTSTTTTMSRSRLNTRIILGGRPNPIYVTSSSYLPLLPSSFTPNFPCFHPCTCAVLTSSPPDTRSMMHAGAPRLVEAPTSSHPVPVLSTRHPPPGYGGATESIYPPTDHPAGPFPPSSDHPAGPYPPYPQRGLVKSNSVDIYRLSESPSHAHAHPTANLSVSNAFPSYGRFLDYLCFSWCVTTTRLYVVPSFFTRAFPHSYNVLRFSSDRPGSPMPTDAVTLACSIAPPPPQFYDPRMTTAAEAKGTPLWVMR